MAVVSVMLYHAGFQLFSGGFVGVDIFFVISGYLIGGIIYGDMKDGAFSFASFYTRRVRRILPALLTVLAVVLLGGILLFTPIELGRLGGSAVASVTGLSNVLFWQETDYFAPGADRNPLLMTWSLSVEEQFYVLLPLTFLAMRRWARRYLTASVALLCLASLALSFVATETSPAAAFYLLPTRAWELGAGVLLAIDENDRGTLAERFPRLSAALPVLGLAMILVAIFLFDYRTPFPGLAAIIPVLGAVLIIAGKNGMVKALLSLQPILFIGLISYSLYLWHWPILAGMRLVANRTVHDHLADLSGSEAATALIAALVLASITWRFVEVPFRRSRLTGRHLLIASVAAALAIGLPAAAMAVYPATLSPYSGEGITSDKGNRNCIVGYGDSNLPTKSQCNPEGATIALLGDSHANALALGLRDWAANHNRAVAEVTKSACPPLVGFTSPNIMQPHHARDCAIFNRAALKRVTAANDIKLVVITGYWSAYIDEASIVRNGDYADRQSAGTNERNLFAGLEREIAALRAAGKDVLLLGDVPTYRFNVPTELLAAEIPLRKRVSEMTVGPRIKSGKVAAVKTVSDKANAAIERLAHRDTGIQAILLAPLLCRNGSCDVAVGRQSLYIDNNHLSAAGAKLVFDRMEQQRFRLLPRQ